MFEIKHLKTLTTLAKQGTLRQAAEALFTSQSALSHQIKDLESRLNSPLFIRNTFPVEFTETGQLLLDLADELLPKISATNNALQSHKSALISSFTPLKIAINCHACFQWLLPITKQFSEQKNELTLEFIDSSFDGYQQPKDKDAIADVLFTDKKYNEEGIIYQEIGHFEVIAVIPKESKLAQQHANPIVHLSSSSQAARSYLLPQDFRQLTLLSYPIPTEQLDIFKLFLTPANCKPAKIKKVTNSHVMLQMVSANMGVATLPDWLVGSITQQSLFHCLRLGKTGIHKKLYARYNKNSKKIESINVLLPKAIKAFSTLYRKP